MKKKVKSVMGEAEENRGADVTVLQEETALTALTGSANPPLAIPEDSSSAGAGVLVESTALFATITKPAAANGMGIAKEAFIWHKDCPPGSQTEALCKRLCETGDLYRTPTGSLLWLEQGRPPRRLDSAVKLEGFIRSHFPVQCMNNGKMSGNCIPSSDLNVLLATDVLQRELKIVDRMVEVPTYNSRWELTRPGYNDGPEGERYYYTGDVVTPKSTPERILQFLSAMFFKSEADSTNALALALTILLRLMWPGKKPFGAVTANKSHAGKDTVVSFASGRTKGVEISWHYRDWALQNEAVSALVDPAVGVLTLGNIRSGSGIIESPFIERIVTAPKALMQSSKRRGDGYERDGDFVVCATANLGRFSGDLTNRSLPIDLEQIGDIADRKSPIGDPRHEFLPAHNEEIEAELCGLIENWKAAGSPLDDSVKHPMREWVRTIGGILKANGFKAFLANWQFERSVNDSVREALALIAHASPANRWLRVGAIVKTAVNEGVVGVLMDSKHRESERSMERQLGVILSAHRDETVHLETEGVVVSYVIRKERNDQTGQLATVYRFDPVEGHINKANANIG